MITSTNFRDLLIQLGFTQTENVFSKDFSNVDAYLRVDFNRQELIYPEDKGLKINERQLCNFEANENFVVFECVCRLLEKGYKLEHIELELHQQVGHGASGGRADILVRDNDGKPLLIIECKAWGDEFNNAWKDTLNDKGQLFTYTHQERSTQYLCLYVSGLQNDVLKYVSYISVTLSPCVIMTIFSSARQPNIHLHTAMPIAQMPFTKTENAFTRAIMPRTASLSFELDIQSYQIGKAKYTVADLQTVTEADIQPKYSQAG